MTGSANYGTYANTEEELDTFLRHSIKPFMKRRLSELDSLRAKNEHLEEQLRLVRSVAIDFAKPLPRVITADELRRGQKIAVFDDDESSIGVVAHSSKYSIDFTNYGGWSVSPEEMPTIVLLADAQEEKPRERAGKEVSAHELEVGDIVDVWHGDDVHEPYYPSATIESASPLIADQFDFEGLEHSFPRFQFRLLKRPDKKPDNPWFATVYEDATYWAGTWRGTPIRPTEIRKGDVYDIHTAHGSTITGIRSARNGVYKHHDGDQYRLVHRP